MTPALIARIEAMIAERVIIRDEGRYPGPCVANYELGYLDAILRHDGLSDKTAEAIWPCLVEGFSHE